MKYKSLVVVCAVVVINSLLSAQEIPKQAIKANSQRVYEAQKSVDTFSNIFLEGEFFGRLRSNTFIYNWEQESTNQKNYIVSALGGSVVYKSANFKGLSFGGALYYSRAFFDNTSYPVQTLSKAKDLLSKFDYTNTGSKNMAVLGEAYIAYDALESTNITLGRQLVEGFYTKSNDTKMIPNTFDGIVLKNHSYPDTTFSLAYLAKQKLRDHTQTHSVLVYGDANATSSNNPQWSQNDDSVMHKGLTYTALKAAGVSTQAPLITGDITHTSIKNLRLDLSFYYVPELLSQVMGELNYTLELKDFSITPGFRYIKQIDDKAGEIGGAAYNVSVANLAAYEDPNSLDSQMIAARLVMLMQNYKLNIAYTQVMDEADLITPWRGFPTSGYTRSMARYNWQANTKSYRIELVKNANDTGVYKNVFIQTSVLHTDADESKGYYDENYYYVGLVQNPLPQLQYKLRLGYQDTEAADADGLDGRLEFNYIF